MVVALVKGGLEVCSCRLLSHLQGWNESAWKKWKSEEPGAFPIQTASIAMQAILCE